MAGWEVFALRYAVHERRAFENFIRAPDPHDAPMPMDYFVWVVRRGGRVVVVDTGFTADGRFIDGVLYHGGMVLRRRAAP